MTNQSALTHPVLSAHYTHAHARMMHFLSVYHHALIDSGYLEDLDEYVTRVVSPAFGEPIPARLFDDALQAYGEWQDVLDGNNPALKRNRSGTVDNTLALLDQTQDVLDQEIRAVLNSIGIN